MAEKFLPSLLLRAWLLQSSAVAYTALPVEEGNKVCSETHFTALTVSAPHLLTWPVGGNLLSPKSHVSMLPGNK